MLKTRYFWLIKKLLWIIVLIIGFYASLTLADEVNTIGGIADQVVKSFQSIGKLMLASSYLAGIGFTIAAVFKFKQHKDNPTQIPVGTPIALLGIAVILIFLPGIIKPVGLTLFGTSVDLEQMAGGFTGSGACKGGLPGSGTCNY